MKLSNLLVVNAIVALAFGIGFVLVPGTVFSIYGVTPGPEINLAGQLFGSALVAIGLVSWLARNVSDRGALRAITTAQVVSTAIGLLVVAIGTVSGVLNSLGWFAVVIYIVLAVGFAYFLFMSPARS